MFYPAPILSHIQLKTTYLSQYHQNRSVLEVFSTKKAAPSTSLGATRSLFVLRPLQLLKLVELFHQLGLVFKKLYETGHTVERV